MANFPAMRRAIRRLSKQDDRLYWRIAFALLLLGIAWNATMFALILKGGADARETSYRECLGHSYYSNDPNIDEAECARAMKPPHRIVRELTDAS